MHPKWIEHRNKDYDKWIKTKSCLVCGGHSEPHHLYHARRNSFLQVPLCREHHTVYHTRGGETAVKSFEDKYNITLVWEIINLLAEFVDKNLCK